MSENPTATRSRSGSTATVYGYPRQGPHRQLKKAVEAYWAGRSNADTLLAAARDLRLQRLTDMREAGLDEVPSNDFSLYDHVLDTAWMLGAIPRRHVDAVPDVRTPAGRLDRYFAMARGAAIVAPLEMTKWFDTNYHYLVPELGEDTVFVLDPSKPLAEFLEAKTAGVITRPVILGPLTFLQLAKAAPGRNAQFDPLTLLERIVPLYAELLGRLHQAGAQWVQIDEPILVIDQPAAVLAQVDHVYRTLAAIKDRPKLLLATYFDQLGDALPVLAATEIDGLAMDFTGPAAANLIHLTAIGGLPGKRLVAGIIDGRNIWRTDLTEAFNTLAALRGLADQVDVAASCSLLHVPIDLALERNLDPQIGTWLAFARQKLDEITLLAAGFDAARRTTVAELMASETRLVERAHSPIVFVDAVRRRAAAVTDADLHRTGRYPQRHIAQQSHLVLPALPTTTIGSFPQTSELRRARALLRSGQIDANTYDEAMRAEIRSVIAQQTDLGLDVLVHGEPERNDMVQYFAEQLTGFLATTDGWVQSYGTRYIRPPIIVGDVSRPAPMTVQWATYAQSLTAAPVKGMLTGPVTMLAWSFVRDDLPLADTARQVALALRDEVQDLQAAGITVIQVDEPALRETLPLRAAGRAEYLKWAVEAFRLTTSGADDETQIHTHMCYAEFDDILPTIAEMDADVISLEAARSDMAIVKNFAAAGYPNDIGPGVWDIHSPRVPATEEIAARLARIVKEFPPERLWVNPDCGLKTRGYREVQASLSNMVAATTTVRTQLG
ncbi:methionine synthase (B12-independent) [Nakamurella panacisegetis]|uniref:5-methyltetrahydropteroyltriglutamate--homocysteine methyltransferase n=1 Tax=Nakamurella panacisegetis TaxID=1090615 RepID=A0A1H0RJJ0_9ACTN|nr:5-methyltetrahydropteroyltriglutamate--homocysteine S-methyltransferase [Nakamurella panacisegetis]SDP29697.1 methionine synthase (B12-independent) [Nakamurella panacisegetis]